MTPSHYVFFFPMQSSISAGMLYIGMNSSIKDDDILVVFVINDNSIIAGHTGACS